MFNFINNLFEKRQPVLSGTGQFNGYYMVLRFLSMYPGTLLLANDVNYLSSRLPNWAIGCWLYAGVKKHRYAPRIGYVKGEKSADEDKLRAEVKGKLRQFLNISDQHAEQTFNLLTAQGIDVYGIFGQENRKKVKSRKVFRTGPGKR